ncbi:C-C motif chemokine 25 [Xenopus tropicalis]|uniref:C-C motif chemokine 25 n=1 Tax=Xenopus tropicalis TaxID=8364 RepID=A0A8J1JWM9_XENTR|nr:C-C motif chemokine 25 [Xenopus tropicalis]
MFITFSTGDFENCCLSYAKVTQYSGLYKHIRYYQLQEISESCNMRAVIFYLKKRIICANPMEQWVGLAIKQFHKMKYPKHQQMKAMYSG